MVSKASEAFARAAQPGDDDELIPRDLDVDGLEVVLPRPADDDAIVGHVHARRGAVHPLLQFLPP